MSVSIQTLINFVNINVTKSNIKSYSIESGLFGIIKIIISTRDRLRCALLPLSQSLHELPV